MAAMIGVCFFASKSTCDYRRPTGGTMPEKAHLISKQRMKRAGQAEHVWHPAVWVLSCHKHHAALDGPWNKPSPNVLPYEQYPQPLLDFAKQHGWHYSERQGWVKTHRRETS